ncbi:neurochondrin isoform X1 [Dioscorea cayenensis subsp. rotundata]|uniref:Neurochondrin isoform X1 n=1 Tax=Dioscorea cayennensis subsp. rotundata TaxID=55577 RepID=A0AB40B184_DIOCR|nr:neurochondrin isoform X1 [Dioscorea cayenensis subsp. rotundata]
MESSSGPALSDCLKLLRGERDEQRLAGLLLATKFCNGEDKDSVLKVYGAVGDRFLDRLLMTGMGKGEAGAKVVEDREAYLKLAITVLAAFCRVPEIASSKEMVSKVPVVVEIISKLQDPLILEECYEFLLLVAGASENGIIIFYKTGVLEMLAPHIAGLNDGSRALELVMKLLQIVLNKLPGGSLDSECISGLSSLVVSIARQFGVLHNALKFDALHLLTFLLSSKSTLLHGALVSIPGWSAYIRAGILEILQNRVVSAEKLQALLLAESVMSVLGEHWLLEQSKLYDVHDTLPVDKNLLLVLESARVEVAVILNELAYLKYEASDSSTASAEVMRLKRQNLAISYSLIEKIIKLISNVSDSEGLPIKESTITKAINGLNETINLVLDFLQDSKDHGQRRGDDLLASVRLVGSYLAETPFACKEKAQGLLEFMFSVEGEDESSPFHSICFLLPMLCQITMEIDGCKVLASFGGHTTVIECLVKMILQHGASVEDTDLALLACETIINFLIKRKDLAIKLGGSQLVHLLRALALWTEGWNDPSIVMMAAGICTLAFDSTSEGFLLKYPDFDSNILESLAQLIARSLKQEELSNPTIGQLDLHQIIQDGYSQWVDQFPHVRNVVEQALST